MSDGIWSAVSGAMGQMTALDVAAENLANASSPAYHGDRAIFHESLSRAKAKKGGDFELRYGSVGSIATDHTAGAITATGRPLDIAIKGDGFLVVKTAAGERYTRLGALQLGKDGNVVTRDGDPVLGIDRRPIRATPTSEVMVGHDGSVHVDGEQTGQLLLVRFADPSSLVKEGASLLRGEAAAGTPVPSPSDLEVGALEGSNVSAVKGMVDIVNATRAFDVCERAIDAFRDADRRAALDVMAVK
jgi:flagellar basal body rod protein FlgG